MAIKQASQLLRIFASAVVLAGCVLHEPSDKDLEWPPSLESAVGEAPSVPFCEIVRDASRYDKKIVRTQAVFQSNRENQALSEPACGVEDTYMWVEFDPAYQYSAEPVKRRFDELLCPDQPCPVGRARVTVVGRFHGPDEGPYGHLDGYRFRFVLLRLEQAEPAEPQLAR